MTAMPAGGVLGSSIADSFSSPESRVLKCNEDSRFALYADVLGRIVVAVGARAAAHFMFSIVSGRNSVGL